MNPTVLLSAAAQAAGTQLFPPGSLYVVATPIGNMADLTLRAVHTLAVVDAVACEDTRTTGLLLQALGLRKPLLAVHEHNERQGAQAVIERLAQGQRLAYVSDAGTPGLSDPGAVLVQAVQEAGFRCVPIPGASAALAALSVAGDAASVAAGRSGESLRLQGFRFMGFLPAKGAARAAAVRQVALEPACVVLFEAPHRIEELAQGLCEALAGLPRRVTLARELTKQFETVHTATVAELPQWLAAEANRRRGEFVLVLHAQEAAEANACGAGPDGAPPTHPAVPPEAQRVLRLLLDELSVKQSASLAAQITAIPRKTLYALALEIKGNS